MMSLDFLIFLYLEFVLCVWISYEKTKTISREFPYIFQFVSNVPILSKKQKQIQMCPNTFQKHQKNPDCSEKTNKFPTCS